VFVRPSRRGRRARGGAGSRPRPLTLQWWSKTSTQRPQMLQCLVLSPTSDLHTSQYIGPASSPSVSARRDSTGGRVGPTTLPGRRFAVRLRCETPAGGGPARPRQTRAAPHLARPLRSGTPYGPWGPPSSSTGRTGPRQRPRGRGTRGAGPGARSGRRGGQSPRGRPGRGGGRGRPHPLAGRSGAPPARASSALWSPCLGPFPDFPGARRPRGGETARPAAPRIGRVLEISLRAERARTRGLAEFVAGGGITGGGLAPGSLHRRRMARYRGSCVAGGGVPGGHEQAATPRAPHPGEGGTPGGETASQAP